MPAISLRDGEHAVASRPAPIGQTGAVAASDWIVVGCHPNKESLALENLRRQAFEGYCPMLRRQVRHARRTYDTLRPLFPSYVFVALESARGSWRRLLSTRGVRSVIGCGGSPSTLKNEFIESLRAREVDGAISRPVVPYRVGQRVRLNRGAFDGLVATIIDIDERDRVVILLDLLSRPVRVNVKSGHIGAIAD
jgi:transcriptional antiterminator RfaH